MTPISVGVKSRAIKAAHLRIGMTMNEAIEITGSVGKSIGNGIAAGKTKNKSICKLLPAGIFPGGKLLP